MVSKVGNGVEHIRVGYASSTRSVNARRFHKFVHNVPADKAAILPDAISFEQAAAFSRIDRFTLLCKTYEVKPDEPFLFHAAAGGVGLIACHRAKVLSEVYRYRR